MKKTWKNFALIGLVAIIALFGLTACGEDPGNDGGGPGGGGPGGGGGGYVLGGTGPGGGKIFYVSAVGFTMTDNNQVCHYLEASTTDQGSLNWASSGFTSTEISGIGTAIGTGRKNTATILATDATAPAALACKNYTGGEKNDWFMPSKDELNQLYVNRTHVGTFTQNAYLSSSQFTSFPSSAAAAQSFLESENGAQGNRSKNQTTPVRAIRAF